MNPLAKALGYYPNEAYIKRKWAPEPVPADALRALAQAQMMATQQGILPPSLAQAMLPIAMTEGRWDDFGVNYYGYPPTPERDQLIKRMGLTVGDFVPGEQPPPESANWSLADWDEWEERRPPRPANQAQVLRYYQKKGGGPYSPGTMESGYVWQDYDDPEAGLDASARMAALMLREKAAQYGEGKAVERWNGRGRSAIPGASAKQYARKVEQARRMLEHPANQAFREAYERYLRGGQ